MATVTSSHTPDTPSLHITHEQGASYVVEISNQGADYILELNQNVTPNNIVVNGDGASDYTLVVNQSVDDFNVVIGGGIPDYFEISNLPTLGTASAQNIEYFALAVHTHAISEITGLQAALDAAALSGEDNVQANWAETNSAADSFILNKPVLFDGQYANLSGLPTLFDGNYNSLSNLPTLFDGDYNSLTNLPTLFDGDYNSLTNLPSLFDGTWASLTGKPTLFDGDYNSLTNLPTLFSGSYNDLSDKPTLFDGDYGNLTNVPTTFAPSAHTHTASEITDFDTEVSNNTSVAANTAKTSFPGFGTTAGTALEGDTALFSGAYNDLTGKPTLGTAAATDATDYATSAQGTLADSAVQPADIADFATETYVNNAITDVIDAAPAALDTLNELAASLNDDADFAGTMTTALAGKSDTGHTHTASDITDFDTEVSNNTSVAANTAKTSFPGFGTTAGTALEGDTALFSGAYADLTGKPTIPTNNNELTNGAGYIDDYTVTEADVTAHEAALTIALSQVTGVPSTFTPSAHTHTASEITDFDTEVSNNTSVAANTSKVTFPGFGTTAGTALEGDTALFSGAYADLTGKPTLFDGDYNSLTNLPTLFDGDYNSLTNLPTLFDGAYGSLTGTPTLGTAAAAATTDFAAASHTHVIADITGLQTALDGAGEDNVQADWDETDSADDSFILNKPSIPSSVDDLSDVDTTTSAASTGDVLRWNGSNWAPDAPASGGTQADWDETDSADPAFILNKPTAVADLTHHYARVSLPATHLTGGASEVDFDANNSTRTQVTGFTSDETVGSDITFSSDSFTVGSDGLYHVHASAELQSLVGQRPVIKVTFSVNGTQVDGTDSAYVRQSNVADEAALSVSRILNLTSGDVVTVFTENMGVTTGDVVTANMFMWEIASQSMTVIGVGGTIGEENVNADWNATSGDAEILNKPTLFSGAYADLTGKPTLFDGDYNSLTNLPTLFDGQYSSLTGLPTLFDGAYSSLTGTPDLTTYVPYTGATGAVNLNSQNLSGVDTITASSAMFGSSPANLRAFNIRGTGFDGRLSLQGGSGDNPGIEMTTDANVSRVLLRLQEVGTDGTSLQVYTEEDGGSIALRTTFDDDGTLYIHNGSNKDAGIRNNSGTMQFLNSGGSWTDFGSGSGGGEANVQVDWDETDAADDAFILNKPSIPSSVDDLSDVDTTTSAPSTGDVLEWDGSNWVPGTPATGGGGGDPEYIWERHVVNTVSTSEQSKYFWPGSSIFGFIDDVATETSTVPSSFSSTFNTFKKLSHRPQAGTYDLVVQFEVAVSNNTTGSSNAPDFSGTDIDCSIWKVTPNANGFNVSNAQIGSTSSVTLDVSNSMNNKTATISATGVTFDGDQRLFCVIKGNATAQTAQAYAHWVYDVVATKTA